MTQQKTEVSNTTLRDQLKPLRKRRGPNHEFNRRIRDVLEKECTGAENAKTTKGIARAAGYPSEVDVQRARNLIPRLMERDPRIRRRPHYGATMGASGYEYWFDPTAKPGSNKTLAERLRSAVDALRGNLDDLETLSSDIADADAQFREFSHTVQELQRTVNQLTRKKS